MKESLQVFELANEALADAAQLAHPQVSTTLALEWDASDVCMGSSLQQLIDSK